MPQLSRPADTRPSGGFTLIEVIVASGILGVLFVSAIPLLGHVRTVRQEADRRMIAIQEAANLLESVAALAKTDLLDAESVEALRLSPAAERLPGAEYDIAIEKSAPPIEGQRVTVTVRWENDVNKPASPVVLTAWLPAQGES